MRSRNAVQLSVADVANIHCIGLIAHANAGAIESNTRP